MSNRYPPPGEDAEYPREPWRDRGAFPYDDRPGEKGYDQEGQPERPSPTPPEQSQGPLHGEQYPPPDHGGQGPQPYPGPAPDYGGQYGQPPDYGQSPQHGQQYPQPGWAEYGMPPGPPLPKIVNWATTLLFVLDGVFVLTIIVAALTGSGTFRGIPGQTSSAERAGAVVGVLFVAIVLGGLFLWLAIMTRKGRNWARITSTVLLGLGIIASLSGLGSGGSTALLYLIQLLIEIAVVVLLWLRPSGEYFDALKRSP